jgi:hypothetical protein
VSFRNVNESLDRQWDIGLEVELVLVLSRAEHEFVEVSVLFFGDLFFVSSPNGFHQVDAFPVDRDWEVNEVGILVDDLVYIRWVSEVLVFFFQVQNHASSSLDLFVCLTDLELSSAVRDPHIRLFALLS